MEFYLNINKRKVFILFVLVPIIIGTLIYIFFRPDSLLINKLTKMVFSENFFQKASFNFGQENLVLNLIIYSGTDALWVFSYTFLILIIWDFEIKRQNLFWLIMGLLLGLISEIGQFFHFIVGTFDLFDLIFYVIGFISSIYIVHLLKQRRTK